MILLSPCVLCGIFLFSVILQTLQKFLPKPLPPAHPHGIRPCLPHTAHDSWKQGAYQHSFNKKEPNPKGQEPLGFLLLPVLSRPDLSKIEGNPVACSSESSPLLLCK